MVLCKSLHPHFRGFISAYLASNNKYVHYSINTHIVYKYIITLAYFIKQFYYFLYSVLVAILCFAGAQKFDVIWLHNNKEIKPSKDFQYTNEANIYKLNIAEIFPEDSGTYTCEAFNDAGESFSSCTLIVLGMWLSCHVKT
jgi:hypothetical protein